MKSELLQFLHYHVVRNIFTISAEHLPLPKTCWNEEVEVALREALVNDSAVSHVTTGG